MTQGQYKLQRMDKLSSAAAPSHAPAGISDGKLLFPPAEQLGQAGDATPSLSAGDDNRFH